jgi:hypothetical protein
LIFSLFLLYPNWACYHKKCYGMLDSNHNSNLSASSLFKNGCGFSVQWFLCFCPVNNQYVSSIFSPVKKTDLSSKKHICPVNLSSFLSSKNLLLVLALQDELICVLHAWHILLTLIAFVYPNHIANPIFFI